MLRLALRCSRNPRLQASTSRVRAAAATGGLLAFSATAAGLLKTPADLEASTVYEVISQIAAKVDDLEKRMGSAQTSGDSSREQEVQALLALGPLDGRYRSRMTKLSAYFSEYSLIKYRCMIEVEYFIELCGTVPELAAFPTAKFDSLRDIYRKFSIEDALKIKDTEKITNHDVKAVEYHIKDVFDTHGLQQYKEFIHFALTSQDINNMAVPLSLRDAVQDAYVPALRSLVKQLYANAIEWDKYPMLARTHGQPATPTRMGKEMMVYVERFDNQLAQLETIPIGCKFGGATGGLAAHYIAYPNVDWEAFANRLCSRLGLERQQYTTQIEHYDNLGAMCDNMARINTILIDFCRDMWMYVSVGYFTQTIKKNEVGSSAMPHKVNPIDFENAEGNCGVGNAIFSHLSAKLPISRLQRDLSDSTVIRNLGVPVGHSMLAFSSAARGLGKMNVNPAQLDADLEANWAVCSEAVQTILRRENYPKPYEALKALTRVSNHITRETMREFIDGLDVSPAVKAELRHITPQNFSGKVYVK